MSFLRACVKSLTRAIISLVPMHMKTLIHISPDACPDTCPQTMDSDKLTLACSVFPVALSDPFYSFLHWAPTSLSTVNIKTFLLFLSLFPFTDTENGAAICFSPFWFTCYLCSAFFLVVTQFIVARIVTPGNIFWACFWGCFFVFFLLLFCLFFMSSITSFQIHNNIHALIEHSLNL